MASTDSRPAAPTTLNSNLAPDAEQQKLITKLREWLQPTNFLSPGGEYAKHVRAYTPGTGSWMRKSPEFRSWRGTGGPDEVSAPGAARETGCLWVKGVPGSGKSVLSASIVHLLEEVEPQTPVLFFFFRQIVQRNHDPRYLIRDFVSQLLPHSSILRSELEVLSEAARHVSGVERASLWDTLMRAMDSLDKVYCVVDALDEMDDEHFDFISTLRDLGLRDPRKIKVLLTSRPIPKIEPILRHPNVVDVKLQPSVLYPDIVRYANARLGSLIPRLSPEKERLVRDAICQRAQGLFLHARIMTDNLTEGLKADRITEDTLPDSLERLPPTLKDMYEEMLKEHAARSGVDRDQQVRILSCVTSASRPLRVIELGALMCNMRGEPKDLKRGKTLVREGCGRLLEILEDESVSVIHHSFTEFLRDGTRRSTPGAFPVLDSDRTHSELAVACLEYLDSTPFTRNAGKSQEGQTTITLQRDLEDPDLCESDCASFYSDETVRDDPDVERADQVFKDLHLERPLMEYALHNWEHHVKKAQGDDNKVLQALTTFLIPGRPAFELWVHNTHHAQYQKPPYDPLLRPIHLAAHIGLVSYAETLLDADPRLVHLRQGGGLRPLAIAAKQGQTDTAKLLLNRGADPDCPDHMGYKPLHYCATHGSISVARLLLEAGVKPQTQTTKYSRSMLSCTGRRTDGETALQFACASWNRAGGRGVFEAFLPYLRPEDATKCMHSAHDVATLEAILKTGAADVDSFCDGQTKLFKAAQYHDTETVRVLLKYGADPNKRCSSGGYGDDEEKDEVEEDEKNMSDGKSGGGEYPKGPTSIHAFASGKFALPLFDDEDAESSRECLRLLLDAGGNINATCRPTHWRLDEDNVFTPLHFAVAQPQSIFDFDCSGDTAARLTEMFVSNGADINAQTRHGHTPAHFACIETPGVIDVLIRNGADMTKRNRKGMTPLLKLLRFSLNQDLPPETLDCFLSAAGVDAAAVDDAGDGCIHHLMRRLGWKEWKSADISFFQKLASAGADLNRKNNAGTPPLLCYSARSSVHGELFRRLVDEDGLDIDARDGSGTNILGAILKTYEANLEAFKLFVRLGADVNARDNDGLTVLHSAVIHLKDPIEWIRFLVAEGADYMARSHQGDSLVQLAITHTREDKVEEVTNYLVALGVPDSDKNSKGQTRLHLSSARIGLYNGDPNPQIAHLERYRAKSLSFDVTDNLGATPLHYAVGVCEFNVARLLREGACPTRLTDEGVSLLHISAVARQPNIVGLLLSEYEERGVLDRFIDLPDEGPQKRTALHYACRSGRPESVRYLISRGANVHVRDARGLTPLHAALEFPQESRLWPVRYGGAKYLIRVSGEERPSKLPPSPNQSGPDGTCDIVAMLVDAGIDVNEEITVDDSEFTPLDMAIKDGFGAMVKDLVDQGAAPRNWDEVAKFIDQPGVDADVELLLEISTGKEIPADDTSYGSRFKDIPSELFRLLCEGKYRAVAEFARRSGTVLDSDGHPRVLNSILRVLVTQGYTSLLMSVGKEGGYVPQIRDELSVDGDEDGTETLLMAACNRELPSLPIIKLLVEDFGLDVNEASGREGIPYRFENATPLHALARGHHWWQIEALEYLLERGANIEATNSQGQTPLLVAISSGYSGESWTEETAKVLLRHGANPNVCGNEERPDTCLVSSRTAAVTKLLLQYGADAKSAANWASLTHAVELMDEEMVGLLIEAGQDVNLCVKERYPLHEAASGTYSVDYNGALSIDRCICMVRLLLRKGADPFAKYTDGTTVLQGILEDCGVIDPILDIPGLDIEHRGKKNRTLLITTSVPMIDSHWNSWRLPAAMAATIKSRHIMRLLELGAAVDAIDDDGRTALHWFCTMPGDSSDECKAAFDALLDRGGPSLIQARDGRGEKPLHLALQARQTWAVQRLVDRGADIREADARGNNALHHCARGLVGERTRAAAAAVEFRRLVERGIDINGRNLDGETPLFIFVSVGWMEDSENFDFHSEHLSLFLDAGADVTARNGCGATLLHVVAGIRTGETARRSRSGQVDDAVALFKRLLELGADPRAEDDEMRTAIDCAVARGRTEIVRLFKGEGKKVALDEEEGADGDGEERSEPGYEMV